MEIVLPLLKKCELNQTINSLASLNRYIGFIINQGKNYLIEILQ